MVQKIKITIATNNGDIGGGEVMLFNIARQIRFIGHPVTIVGPSQPSEVIDAAMDEGFDVVSLPARNRQQYIAQLRIWDKHKRTGILWCNGLVPSFATARHKNRIVHLHQIPTGKLKWLVPFAQKNSLTTLLPSRYSAHAIPSAKTFYNWTSELDVSSAPVKEGTPVKIGFLGRPSTAKGTGTLIDAISMLNKSSVRYKLVVAGDYKFIDNDDRQKIEQQLDSLGESAQKTGWIQPADFFQEINILIVPSQAEESFGLVAAEAMSARTPLIVSDMGALKEVVGENYPWVFEHGKAESLATIIQKVARELQEESSIAQMIVDDAYWRWLENYSPQSGKERVKNLLISLENLLS